jgi:hypothetical protein
MDSDAVLVPQIPVAHAERVLESEGSTNSANDYVAENIRPPEGMTIVGWLRFSSIEHSRPELDYALIELMDHASYVGRPYRLSDDTDSAPDFIGEEKFNTLDDRAVVSVLGSAPTLEVQGHVDSTSTAIQMPFAKKYQQVYQVRFDRPLCQGDCGSWVMDAATRSLLGHIVAGSPKDGLAYIVPYYQVYAHMKTALIIRFRQNGRLAQVPRSWGTRNPELDQTLGNTHLRDALAILEGHSRTPLSSAARGSRPRQIAPHTVDTDQASSHAIRPLGVSNIRHLNETRTPLHTLDERNSEGQRAGPYDAVGYITRAASNYKRIFENSGGYEEYEPYEDVENDDSSPTFD